MTVLVFGATGQVAMELKRVLPEAVFLGRDQADLTRPDACAAHIAPGLSAVINAAAYTAVDAAEDDEATALAVNATAPGAMARAAAAAGVPFLHISTDYVFDGSGDTPWPVEAPTGPLGAYGRTKRAGEEAVRAAGGTHAILRTSWVVSAHGKNFVKTMLRLAETRDRLTIVADQIGGPTPAGAIAEALAAMAPRLAADPGQSGTYHFSGAPDVSWADFARGIFAAAGQAVEVVDISSSDFPTRAARPANSRLDCSATEAAFGIARPDWRAALPPMIAAIRADG